MHKCITYPTPCILYIYMCAICANMLNSVCITCVNIFDWSAFWNVGANISE